MLLAPLGRNNQIMQNLQNSFCISVTYEVLSNVLLFIKMTCLFSVWILNLDTPDQKTTALESIFKLSSHLHVSLFKLHLQKGKEYCDPESTTLASPSHAEEFGSAVHHFSEQQYQENAASRGPNPAC